MRRYSLLVFVCLPFFLFAQKQIDIHTAHSSLVFTVGTDQKLYQSYFGRRLSAASLGELAPAFGVESFLTGGGHNLFTPAVRMVHGDGNPSLDLVVSNTTTQVVSADN